MKDYRMNKNTILFAFALLFAGLPCFSSMQQQLVASNPELAHYSVTIPPRAFNTKTYNGPLKTIGRSIIGLQIGTQDEALLGGWNFSDENRFNNGEVVVMNDPANLHGPHFGEIVVVIGAGPFRKTYPNNPISKKMSQTYHIQCGHGSVHPFINGINLGKFEKNGIMLTEPAYDAAFTAKELDELTVCLPEGALPEPAPSPEFISTPVLPLLGAIANVEILNTLEDIWHAGKAFEKGELAFAYSFPGSPRGEATLGIVIEKCEGKDAYRVQIDAQGTIKVVERKYLAKRGSEGAITQKAE
jgi:hypothetical protein